MRLSILLLALCSANAIAAGNHQRFFNNISALCGQTLSGKVLVNQPADPFWNGKTLRLAIGQCSHSDVVMVLSTGDRKPLMLTLRQRADSLQLEHRYLLPDGSEGKLSRFGGRTQGPGSPARQQFPADAMSKALFMDNNMKDATFNVWEISLEGGQLHYRLDRSGRHFDAAFTLP